MFNWKILDYLTKIIPSYYMIPFILQILKKRLSKIKMKKRKKMMVKIMENKKKKKKKNRRKMSLRRKKKKNQL